MYAPLPTHSRGPVSPSQKFAEEPSPSADGRQRVAHGASRGSREPHPHPHPRPRCRRRGEGHSTQGSRPGLLYAAPDGASKSARDKNFLNGLPAQDRSVSRLKTREGSVRSFSFFA